MVKTELVRLLKWKCREIHLDLVSVLLLFMMAPKIITRTNAMMPPTRTLKIVEDRKEFDFFVERLEAEI